MAFFKGRSVATVRARIQRNIEELRELALMGKRDAQEIEFEIASLRAEQQNIAVEALDAALLSVHLEASLA